MHKTKHLNVSYYGTRKAKKFVRCYWKKALGVYRVELEFHSPLIRQHDIETLEDFEYIPDIVAKHLRFVRIDWHRLRRHLIKKFGVTGRSLFSETRRRKGSLTRVRHYLRRKGIANFHRFLVPLPINKMILKEVENWIDNFEHVEKPKATHTSAKLTRGEHGAREKESA